MQHGHTGEWSVHAQDACARSPPPSQTHRPRVLVGPMGRAVHAHQPLAILVKRPHLLVSWLQRLEFSMQALDVPLVRQRPRASGVSTEQRGTPRCGATSRARSRI